MSALDRTRPASFIDPDGTEHFFKVDSLERSTSKKGSTQEILDSDESITQDQGLKVWTFPIEAYFTGLDYDGPTDAFVAALSLTYSQEKPGILKHPRWGNINVFPMAISQKEGLINDMFVGRVTVTFVEIFPQVFPTSDFQSLLDVLKNLDEMEEESEEIAAGINTEQAQAETNANSKLGSANGTVAKNVSDGSDKFKTIQSSVSNLVDNLGDVVEIIAGIQRLIRTPARVKEQTLNRVNGYLSMIETLTDSFNDDNETSPINRKNNATMMELTAGLGVGGLCEAAAFTDYTVRSEAIAAIGLINEGFAYFDTGFNNARTTGNAIEEYSGDHNFWSLLMDTMRGINQLLLTTAFGLKAEKTFILKNNDNAISLCYEYYQSVSLETINFFNVTNRLINDEFSMIPAGRQITVYI